MSSVALNRRIHKFLDGKDREHPEMRNKDIDTLIAELASEGRSARVF
ncbi:MAG: hypothetical protein ACR2FM_02350 [Candidatus Saccharimonadales bacterium]